MKCPRRVEGPFKLPEEDSFGKDGKCSYCGSLDPDVLMSRLEAGDVMLCPTDKNYKVYVTNKGGEAFKMTHRTDSLPWEGWDSKNHTFVTDEQQETKFYFMHFSDDQRKRFVELLNEKKIKLDDPGHFYRLPYFISR